MFFDKTVAVARMSPEQSDVDNEEYSTIAPNIKINIQPASTDLTAAVEGALGMVFRGFTTYSGIEIGDRITVSGTTKQYIVRGKNDWVQLPIPHVEIILFDADQ